MVLRQVSTQARGGRGKHRRKRASLRTAIIDQTLQIGLAIRQTADPAVEIPFDDREALLFCTALYGVALLFY